MSLCVCSNIFPLNKFFIFGKLLERRERCSKNCWNFFFNFNEVVISLWCKSNKIIRSPQQTVLQSCNWDPRRTGEVYRWYFVTVARIRSRVFWSLPRHKIESLRTNSRRNLWSLDCRESRCTFCCSIITLCNLELVDWFNTPVCSAEMLSFGTSFFECFINGKTNKSGWC
jgi:hypothetical protein